MRLRLAALALTIATTRLGAQTVVASTFGPAPGYTPGNGYFIANGAAELISSVASPFTASAGGTLSSVRVATSQLLTSAVDDVLHVGLYSGSDMNSATLLEEFTGYPPVYPGGIQAFSSVAHPTIAAGQSYFVALSVVDPDFTIYQWLFSSSGSTGTVWFRGGSGTWSSDPASLLPAFDVSVNATSTPEPTTVALLGGGLLALGAAARRRRRGAQL